MFMRVDLPAPFSPRRACTSPFASSKSTPSLATTPGKRFVMPLSSRRGASAMEGKEGWGPAPAPSGSFGLFDRLGDLDLAGDDQLGLRHRLVDGLLRRVRRELAEPDAVLREAERRHAAALEGVVHDRLDGREHGHVHALERAREDVVAEERLVGVHADAPDAPLLGAVESTEPAAAGDLEHDVRAVGDLVERELLAPRLVDEVLRVAVERLDVGIRVRRALLETGDEAVDGRDLHSAYARDRVALGHEPRQVAREVPRLLLLEEEALEVGQLARVRLLAPLSAVGGVDDGEVRLRELLRGRVRSLGHEEADRDDQVEALVGERREVRDVVRVRLGLQHPDLDAELLRRLLEALVGQRVEAAVVQAADVGDEPDLNVGARRLLGGVGRPCLVAAYVLAVPVVVTAAARRDGEQQRDEKEKEQRQLSLYFHGTSLFAHAVEW